jgi:hypothetical protein
LRFRAPPPELNGVILEGGRLVSPETTLERED